MDEVELLIGTTITFITLPAAPTLRVILGILTMGKLVGIPYESPCVKFIQR